jgi:RNA polymerase sigma-70 factor (ECF subfamily)
MEIDAREVMRVTAAMARGEDAAFRQFFAAYFDRLFRYLLVVSGGREDVTREALQGALIRVARHVRPFSTEAAFWSWLTVLARSALIDEERKHLRYRRNLESFADSSALHPSRAPPEDRHLEQLLESALADLSGEDRRLIEDKYLEHRTVHELAEASGSSEKAIESRLTRIRRRLREVVLDRLQRLEAP